MNMFATETKQNPFFSFYQLHLQDAWTGFIYVKVQSWEEKESILYKLLRKKIHFHFCYMMRESLNWSKAQKKDVSDLRTVTVMP